jgi:excisionase family DNA binding protein
MNLFAKERENDQAMPDLSEFMTTQEAAEKLDLTIRAVNRLVSGKKLESVRVGRMYLISRASVRSYLNQTKDMSKNDPRRKTLFK